MALEAEWGRHVATTQVVQGRIYTSLMSTSHLLQPLPSPYYHSLLAFLLRCVQIIYERCLGEGGVQQRVGGSEGVLRQSWPETPYPRG